MKKNRPCRSDRLSSQRSGMYPRLRCEGCGHEIKIPRSKAEKMIKNIIREETD